MDYVPYINDLVQYKRNIGNFSFRAFCKKSGFKSPTYLKWVLDEVRPISPKSVHRFAEGLDLGKRESRHLQLLVNYKEAKDLKTRKFFFEEILTRRSRKEENAFVREQYEYLSHWYYVTIRELAAHPDFREDPEWIQDKLAGTVTVWEIKHALKTLEQLNLFVRDDRGRLRQNDAELHTGKEVESMAAFNYHSEVLKESQEILMKVSHRLREFSSTVSLIDREAFQELKKMMHRFQDEVVRFILSKSHQPSGLPIGDKLELFMLNMQLLPFTRFDEDEFLGGKNDKK
ncbi:MAG: TIGR02147 family protein [Deltaproteobacteria bacterium]|nr:TIGR02147 family protein [Deltaproteobacteria bacterium]